ncbi:MAG: IS200/IS605 family transposase [Bacteroidota bacterium]
MPDVPRYTPTTAHRLFYHFVFRTKCSRPVLCGPVKDRLQEMILNICIKHGYRLIHCKIMPYHAHLLLRLRPRDYLPTVAQMLKGRSAHDLMREFPEIGDVFPPTGERNLWSKGYWVSTAGMVKVDRVRRYVRGQRKHHLRK